MYEGVKPNTNRTVDSARHEQARAIPLTDTELEVLAMGLGLIGLEARGGTIKIGPRTLKVAEALSIRLRAEISR